MACLDALESTQPPNTTAGLQHAVQYLTQPCHRDTDHLTALVKAMCDHGYCPVAVYHDVDYVYNTGYVAQRTLFANRDFVPLCSIVFYSCTVFFSNSSWFYPPTFVKRKRCDCMHCSFLYPLVSHMLVQHIMITRATANTSEACGFTSCISMSSIDCIFIFLLTNAHDPRNCAYINTCSSKTVFVYI